MINVEFILRNVRSSDVFGIYRNVPAIPRVGDFVLLRLHKNLVDTLEMMSYSFEVLEVQWIEGSDRERKGICLPSVVVVKVDR